VTAITVIKRRHDGLPVFRYDGEVVEQSESFVFLRAYFGRDDVATDYITYRRGDLFLEWFYADRWYNVFKIFDVGDGRLKGWYCNITRPAVITSTPERVTVYADDLELDVFVFPNGEVLLLDEDEFAALALSDDERRAALDAVREIRRLAARGAAPFDAAMPDV
jgi:hypothetical protein